MESIVKNINRLELCIKDISSLRKKSEEIFDDIAYEIMREILVGNLGFMEWSSMHVINRRIWDPKEVPYLVRLFFKKNILNSWNYGGKLYSVDKIISYYRIDSVFNPHKMGVSPYRVELKFTNEDKMSDFTHEFSSKYKDTVKYAIGEKKSNVMVKCTSDRFIKKED